MDEGSIATIAVSPWATALAMYLFGMATGWLIWGGRRAAADSGERLGPALDAAVDVERPMPATDAAALGALEKELRDARALLAEDDGEADSFAEAISALDATIKRANGRLKLLARAVKKGSSAG